MNYVSTRDNCRKITASEAILQGLAPDGGLYVPEEIPSADIGQQELLTWDSYQLTAHILKKLLPDLSYDSLLQAVKDGYGGKFSAEEITPLINLKNESVLELYHGPTSAFKDMALCLLPRLIAIACEKNGIDKEVLILTATSGDTGKAALAGFADAPQTKVMVFYPLDGVSQVQQAQMVTQEGKNVCVCAVEGNFDDAQRGVKDALGTCKSDIVSFSSANSINIGRLAPQVAYYFKAYGLMLSAGKVKYGEKIDVAVPTGNFGNILAGYIAKQMGLPIGKLICASNANDVLTEFISTGVYDRRRPFFQTASPSMDILVSSNLERLLYFASGGNDKLVASLMKSLNEEGAYKVPDDLLSKIQADFLCGKADDNDALKTIAKYWGEEKYLMDPHTAVAFAVVNAIGKTENPVVVLSTASPYKFAPAMISALGADVPESGFEAMRVLNSLTDVKIPDNLASLENKPVLHKDTVKPADIVDYVNRKAGEKVWAK